MQFFDSWQYQLMLVGQSGTSTSYRSFGQEEPTSPENYNSSNAGMEAISPGRQFGPWHFNQPSQSFLTNEYVSVWPKRACVIFSCFYHKDAGRHSHGIRSTLCRDRQTGSANKMECLCISHLTVNIQIPLPTGTVCVPVLHAALLEHDILSHRYWWQFNGPSWPAGSNHHHNPPTHYRLPPP